MAPRKLKGVSRTNALVYTGTNLGDPETMNIKTRLRNGIERTISLHKSQPMAAGALLLVVGIHCGYCLGMWPLAAAAATVCGALAARYAGWLRGLGLLGLVFLLGWGRAAWDADGRSREAERLRAEPSRQTFICRVGPEVAVRALRGEAAKRSFKAEAVRCERGRTSFTIRHLPVDVNWFGGMRAAEGGAPRPGEVWRVTGKLSLRKGRGGLMSATVNTGEGRSERLKEADGGSWPVRLAKARLAAARRVTLGIEDWGAVPALNAAMLLGCRGEMPPDMRRVFAASGTIHVFAISGLHIVLVATVLTLLVAALGVPRQYWVVGVAPLLVFYTVVTGARPSAVRACLMALLYFAAPLLGRRPNGLAALLGTALVVFAWHPWLVSDAGCILSFTVMGGLVVFCRPFSELARRACGVAKLEERERLLQAAGEKAAAGRARRLRTCAIYLADSMAVSLAAWLASVPLTACYFGRFTPGGLLANLVITPCAFLVVVSGCCGLAASFISAWAASCFNHAAGLFTWVMIQTAEITAGCPWGTFRVAKWSMWEVGGWFLGLAALALWLHLRRPADGLAWLERGDSGS